MFMLDKVRGERYSLPTVAMVPSDRVSLEVIGVSVLPLFKYHFTESLSLLDELAYSLVPLDVLFAAQVNVRLPPSNVVTLPLG